MGMFMALMVAMVFWVYTYPPTHRVVYFSVFSFLYVSYTSVKWFKNK